MHSSELQ